MSCFVGWIKITEQAFWHGQPMKRSKRIGFGRQVERNKKILEYYSSGLNINQIAKMFDIDYNSVKYVVESYG